MISFFDRFILGFPRLYIKQYAYAWIPYIVLWSWPPNIASIFLLVIVLGMALLEWRYAAWLRRIRGEHAPGGGKFYMDTPQLPAVEMTRRVIFFFMTIAVLAYFIRGQFGLSFWQYFIMVSGFTLMYKNSYFFGNRATYIVTASGIAIYFAQGHLDYPLFLRYGEMRSVEKTAYQKEMGWAFMGKIFKKENNGLLIHAKSPDGFSKRLKKVFITPQDISKFVEQLPYGFQ